MVDEAHCIASWGQSEFRPDYLKLGVLRAITPHVKVLALTATATSDTVAEIKRYLLTPDAVINKQSPDRSVFAVHLSRTQFTIWV